MMNTRIKIYLLAGVALLIGLGSCKKSFLEVDPKGKVIAKTTNDYNLLLNNTSYLLSMSEFPNVVMGDEIVSVEPYYSAVRSIPGKLSFQYADDIYLPTETPREAAPLLKLLYTYNKIVNEVMDSEEGTAPQKLAIKAEALTNRAWIYLLLINYYGKPYVAATAASDPGFFIIKTSDVTVDKFERSSVQAVYDFILDDLQTAIPNLPRSLGTRMRASKSAAEALLGRTYWFMSKYQEALTQFNNAFTDMPADFPIALFDYKVNLASGGVWGYNPLTSPNTYVSGPTNGPQNQEVFFYKSVISGYSYSQNDFMLSAGTMELFKTTGNSDERLKLYSDKQYGGGPIGTPGVKRKAGFPYIQMGMTLPDLYLMRAECRVRMGDTGGAKSDVETLRKSRMSAADATVNITDPTALLKYIIEERIREFALQGYRWFDMRRLSTDPLFANQVYVHQVLSKTGTVVSSFPLKPERFTLRIPGKIMDMNPGTINNP
jgi:tetratricopeptide (TPR) repeat protein